MAAAQCATSTRLAMFGTLACRHSLLRSTVSTRIFGGPRRPLPCWKPWRELLWHSRCPEISDCRAWPGRVPPEPTEQARPTLLWLSWTPLSCSLYFAVLWQVFLREHRQQRIQRRAVPCSCCCRACGPASPFELGNTASTSKASHRSRRPPRILQRKVFSATSWPRCSPDAPRRRWPKATQGQHRKRRPRMQRPRRSSPASWAPGVGPASSKPRG
mmetsp:Transcript_156433/g.501911  ORF Transcript_156433/g.501911 Transcript_156433/m.501911 type:complete len:215 (-) Transcript_156433:4711-5355(-)